jgi:uncharacterized membrane protein
MTSPSPEQNHNNQRTSEKILRRTRPNLGEREKRVARHLHERIPISRDTSEQFETELTLGQRIADRVAAFGGSWPFIILFMSVLVAWIVVNTFLLARLRSSFDPYPYILLNLVLSMLAAIQAPVIMMSQNRQADKDRLDAEHDYEVNLKAELEIMALHEKLDTLRQNQWNDLIQLQHRQLDVLERLSEGIGKIVDRSQPSGSDVQ